MDKKEEHWTFLKALEKQRRKNGWCFLVRKEGDFLYLFTYDDLVRGSGYATVQYCSSLEDLTGDGVCGRTVGSSCTSVIVCRDSARMSASGEKTVKFHNL